MSQPRQRQPVVIYMTLQQACRKAIHRGDLGRAGILARRASVVATHAADQHLLHLAAINRSMVLLETGDIVAAEKGLREVVLQSTDDEVICRAAYYLASGLRRQHRISRALFFARKAADKARSVAQVALRARCHNLLGNIHLNQGSLARACGEYRTAMALWDGMDGDQRFSRAIVLDNLGYALTLAGEMSEGLGFLEKALELSLAIADRRTEAECRQDLAHTHLCLRQPEAGREHALLALAIAEQENYLDIIKNCSYVLGEMAAMAGNLEERDLHFGRLQSYYPDFPHLRSFLRLFDVSRLLTFH